MYIKNKEVKNDSVVFSISPVYDTHRLINRARAFVDDYFTFISYDFMTEKYNFRKYCIEPIFKEKIYKPDENNVSDDQPSNLYTPKILIAVHVSDLTYYEQDFTFDVYKNGEVIFYYPENITDKSKELFTTRIERMVQYVSVS